MENEQIPSFVRRQLGLAAHGVGTWNYDNPPDTATDEEYVALPLIRIGKTMAKLKALPGMIGQQLDDAMKCIKDTLRGLLPDLLSEYTAVHKIRGRAVCHDGWEQITGWCFGNTMSDSNAFVWGCLGEPSQARFKVMAHQPSSKDLEDGFLICTIGQHVHVAPFPYTGKTSAKSLGWFPPCRRRRCLRGARLHLSS